MAKSKLRQSPTINAGSMAYIAFLLLIFFLMTTTIQSDKGLAILLPPLEEKPKTEEIKILDRNLCKVLVNSNDQLLVNGQPMNVKEITEYLKKFISNNKKDPSLSDSPEDAIVSVKNDRGTSYKMYIKVMDHIRAAYNQLRAEQLGLTLDKYLELSRQNPKEKEMLDRVSKIFPLNISEAEPSTLGGAK